MAAFVSGGVVLGGKNVSGSAVCKTGSRLGSSSVSVSKRSIVRMGDDGFADLQPGDPGYKPKASETVKVSDLGISPFADDANFVSKVGGKEYVETVAEDIKAGRKDKVKEEVKAKVAEIKKNAPPPPPPPKKRAAKAVSMKRGLQLLVEDILKTGPEAAGVGRQDLTVSAEPQFGEPGYVAPAYKVAMASSLGISSFADDKNSVLNVGGLQAVIDAAEKVKAGKLNAETIEETLKEGGKMIDEVKETEEIVYSLPSYLLPLPEDTPRKGCTWKNYSGR